MDFSFALGWWVDGQGVFMDWKFITIRFKDTHLHSLLMVVGKSGRDFNSIQFLLTTAVQNF